MGSGRKPLPTNIKLIKGTLRTGRINALEPVPKAEAPIPPGHLTPTALEEWNRIVPELMRVGILTKIDSTALAAYCTTFARWALAEENIAKAGFLVKTTNGNIVPSPLVGIANRALDIMLRYLGEFGMTPSSRTKIKATGDETGKKNKWA